MSFTDISPPAAMDALKRRLADIHEIMPPDRPILYLDYPVHLNIGDSLINMGTEAFFQDHGHRVVGRASLYNFTPSLQAAVTPDTIIALHGGGNLGDIYPWHQTFREDVVAAFPDNRIVFLPQTIHYGSEEALAASSDALRRHGDLHILVRDEKSYEISATRFTENTVMIPDMAHQLWGRWPTDLPASAESRVLPFLRKDEEAVATEDGGVDEGEPVDWEDLIQPWETLMFRACRKTHWLDGRVDLPIDPSRAWYKLQDRIVERMVGFFRDHEHVVTSRLHGCILASLLNRRVTLLDNSYGKLSAYHDAWFADHPEIMARAA